MYMCSSCCSLANRVIPHLKTCLQCPAHRLKEACPQQDLIGNKELPYSQWLGKGRPGGTLRAAWANTQEEERENRQDWGETDEQI